MSSPTLNIGDESAASQGQHQTDRLEEAKKLISPLPADEQDWLDKARTQTGEPPEPANAADDMLESGTLLTDTNLYTQDEIAQEIAKISKLDGFTYLEQGEIAEGIAAKTGLKPVVFVTTRESAAEVVRPADPKAMDSVRAANDDWASGGTYSVFESDIMKDIIEEHVLNINTRSDGSGRQFYNFDNGININLTAVVFEMKGAKMVKLQNTILSLDALLSVKRCVNLPDIEKKDGLLTLRSSPNFQGGVECTFEDNATLAIPNISVDSLMMVISHLSQVHAVADLILPTEKGPRNEIVMQQKSDESQADELLLLLSHGLIAAASFAIGTLIGRYTA
jgi:hypothetical protein